MTRAAALAVLGLAFAACATDDLDGDQLIGRRWTLREMRPSVGPPPAVPLGDRFTLLLDPTGPLSARADCNTCSGTYEAADGRLRVVAGIICTRVFCAATAPHDTEYVRQLEAARSYAVEARTLTIGTERGLLVFDR